MRILLVDDGNRKAPMLREFLRERGLITDGELHVLEAGLDARNAMRQEQFDLLILDILLPWRREEGPAAAGSRGLLDSILYEDDVLSPRQIVGLTGDDDAAKQADPYFSSRTWTVLRFDETSTAWMEAIGASITYMRQQAMQVATYATDLFILAALRDPEMDAVHRLPWAWRAEEPLDDATFIRRGSFESDGETFSVVTAVADRMGMVSAAVLATKVITTLKPKFCVMVGICAGVKSDTRFGDVILADPSWDYQSGKRIKEVDGTHTFKIDPHQIPASQLVRTRMKQLALDRPLLDEIRRSRDDDPGHDLRILVGPTATGSAVVADSDKVLEVQEQQRKVIAIEMETYGLYCAAIHAAVPRPTAFSLKAVSDFADEKKGDGAQKYAAYTSASVMRSFFERYMRDLEGLAGQ